MLDLTGKIAEISIDYKTGLPRVSIILDNRQCLQEIEELKESDKLTIKVSKYRKKRSLDSNAYFWALLDKLAEKIRENKTDIYRRYVREIGGNCSVMCIKNEAVEKFDSVWQKNGLGWFTDSHPNRKYKDCTTLYAYYGSSTYDTEQMSRLIDMVVQDCEAVGITTLTPQELDLMMKEWNGKK